MSNEHDSKSAASVIVSEWASSFLTALRQHKIGYSMTRIVQSKQQKSHEFEQWHRHNKTEQKHSIKNATQLNMCGCEDAITLEFMYVFTVSSFRVVQ